MGDAFSVENGYDQVKRIFSDGVRYDAVFAYSSTILLGAIRAFRELGVRIPEQVGIISFDNNGFLDFLDPAITRIEQPLSEIGRLASQVLIDIIENKHQDLPLSNASSLRPSSSATAADDGRGRPTHRKEVHSDCQRSPRQLLTTGVVGLLGKQHYIPHGNLLDRGSC